MAAGFERAFRHPTNYLIAERGGIITGVLPLTHVKSLLFGSSLISNAFAVRGGPIAVDDESRGALEVEAVRLMEALGVPVLELRDFSASRSDWPSKSGLYATFRRRLSQAVRRNLGRYRASSGRWCAKACAMSCVRRSTTASTGCTASTQKTFATSGRRLRQIQFSYSQRRISDLLGYRDDIIRQQSGRIGAEFLFPRRVSPFYGGGIAAARQLAANDFMYGK